MFDFESTVTPEVMMKYLFMPANQIRMPNQCTVLTRGIEWINPRVTRLLQYGPINRETHRVNREDTSIPTKLIAICEGLNRINAERIEGVLTDPRPQIQIKRMQTAATVAKHVQFKQYHHKIMVDVNPLLIEWMLALVLFNDGRKVVRAASLQQTITIKAFNQALARVDAQKRKVASVVADRDKLQTYIETQYEHLNRKNSAVAFELNQLAALKETLKDVRDENPDLFDLEEDE